MCLIKVFCRSYLLRVVVAAVACWYPYTAYCDALETTVDVKFVLTKTEAGASAGMTRGDSHPWQYQLAQLDQGLWLSYGEKGWLTLEANGPRSTLIGYAKLLPGHYRIRNSGSVQYPFRCDAKFEVPPGGTGSLTVHVPHDSRKRLKGKIRLVEEDSGKPLGGVSLHSELERNAVGKLRRWGNRESIVPINKVTTSEGGVAEFWFLADSEALVFTIKDYRFVEAGSKLKRMFSSEMLLKDVTWTISELPVMAKLKVFLKMPDGAHVPLEEKVVTMLFPKDKGFKFWRLPIFEYQSGTDINFDYRLAADVGTFVPEEKAFVYRNLRGDQKYIVGEAVELFKSRLRLVDGSKMKFRIDTPQVFVGEVETAWVKRKAEDQQTLVVLKGRVVDSNGDPMRGANIRVHGARGAFAMRSDEQGEFSQALEPGSYHVSLFEKGYESWSKRIQLRANMEQSLIIDVKRLPVVFVNIAREEDEGTLGGQVFVHAAGPKNIVAHSPISADGVARIDGIPQGNILVVFRGRVKTDKVGLASEELLTGSKEFEIKEGKDVFIDLKVHTGLVVDVVIGNNEPGLDEAALLLWTDWEGTKVLMGGGRWVKKDPASSKLYVPHPGKYAVEILVPKGKAGDRLKNGDAYWGDKIEIDTTTRSVSISIDENTKHDFTGLY